NGFISRFGEKQGLVGQVKKGCGWTLLALALSINLLSQHCHLVTFATTCRSELPAI
ncbi:hypothetical protein KUCAC02_034062, partial [Chaenocephalus aceratus]